MRVCGTILSIFRGVAGSEVVRMLCLPSIGIPAAWGIRSSADSWGFAQSPLAFFAHGSWHIFPF